MCIRDRYMGFIQMLIDLVAFVKHIHSDNLIDISLYKKTLCSKQGSKHELTKKICQFMKYRQNMDCISFDELRNLWNAGTRIDFEELQELSRVHEIPNRQAVSLRAMHSKCASIKLQYHYLRFNLGQVRVDKNKFYQKANIILRLPFKVDLKSEKQPKPVSYTHLTLPTILLVQISVVAVSLKKKTKVITEDR
eukprot:TRINITY_DN29985_c0_g1_i3.p1 TRINITY_DN29985_c0_g1~~TRINITY_DN29985_c0_g1_i3.p1  ORF type:complete len:193 (+),score=40.18 TRINITY_DN29985_c0_g1_i3:163-741(+)